MPLPRESMGDLFATYPSPPAVIEAAAGRIAGTTAAFESLRGHVDAHVGDAGASTSGDLPGPIAMTSQPIDQATEALAAAAAFGAAAVRRFADHVATYDSGIRGLNERWRSAVAANFGVGSGSDAQDAVGPARSALLAQLRAEYATIEDALDSSAQGVARLLDTGPTSETLVDLFSSGDLPAASLLDGPHPPTGIEATVARLITAGVLPPEAATMTASELSDYLVDHPDVAARLMQQSPLAGAAGTPEGLLADLLAPVILSPDQAAEFARQRQLDRRDLFAGLDAEDAALLAVLFPAAVGNLPGVPFTNRADANRVAVIAALAAEEDNLAGLRDRDAANEDNNGWLGWRSWDDNDLDGSIQDARERIELYRSVVEGDRQILYFDPAGDGAIAELHGTIGPQTDNVGVIVPGTTTDMSSIQGTMDNAQSFADNDPDRSLAMITWMGGDLPDSVLSDAPYNHYTDDLAPSLVGFSVQLGDEIDAEAHTDTQVTIAGHSYGGAVVGIAETYGLEADRVLHIESAGMGHDVSGPDDLPSSQAGVDRYSMTAPGDPIDISQGVNDPLGIDRIGHGADPDTFPGMVRLETGYYADGDRVDGPGSHGGVFQQGSDSWQNMYDVFSGGEVTLWAPPDVYSVAPDGSLIVEPNTEPRETMDIP